MSTIIEDIERVLVDGDMRESSRTKAIAALRKLDTTLDTMQAELVGWIEASNAAIELINEQYTTLEAQDLYIIHLREIIAKLTPLTIG